jgi:hypothetical protein
MIFVKSAVREVRVGSDAYKHVFLMDWVSGFVLGIDIFLGDDLEPDDKLAVTLHLGIFRFTYILTTGVNYD